jgi:cell division cycle protein 20 (cofactor of APC complex)
MYASGGIGNNISLSNSFAHFPKSARRKVCSDPEKILDAPNFVNDFYLNLIDWSSKGIVAVALGQAIYLWNGETGKVDQLSDVGYQGVIVTALSWAKNGKFLAVGLANGSIQVRYY